MNSAAASTGRDAQLDGFELLIATLLFASVVGALIYAAATGQRYQVGDPVTAGNPLTWFSIVVRVWFSFTSRHQLARAGWISGVAVAVLTVVTPLGNTGSAAWATRAAATMAWTGVVMTAVGASLNNRWKTGATVLLFAEVGLRYWSLANWDAVTGRSTVLWGE